MHLRSGELARYRVLAVGRCDSRGTVDDLVTRPVLLKTKLSQICLAWVVSFRYDTVKAQKATCLLSARE